MTQATTDAATNDSDKEIRIPLSKWKIILLLVGGALLIAACIWIFRNADSLKRVDPILSTILGFIGIVFFSMCFGFGLIQLFDKKPGLIINEDGIVNNTTALNTQYIRWENITGWKTLNIKGTKILLVYVDNPEEIIANANRFSRFWLKLNMKSYGTPVSISNNSLLIKFSKLSDIFTEYYSKAKYIEEVLSLLLINKSNEFANSYNLCKILSRYFGIIDCRNIIKAICSKKYVDFTDKNGVTYFELTSIGKNIIEETKADVINKLRSTYRNDKNETIIEAL